MDLKTRPQWKRASMPPAPTTSISEVEKVGLAGFWVFVDRSVPDTTPRKSTIALEQECVLVAVQLQGSNSIIVRSNKNHGCGGGEAPIGPAPGNFLVLEGQRKSLT